VSSSHWLAITIGQYLCPTLVQINSLFQTTKQYRKLCWPDSTCLLFLLRRMIDLKHQKKHTSKGPLALRPPRVNPILARGPRPAKRRREDGVRFKRGSDKVQADTPSSASLGDPPFRPPAPRDKGEAKAAMAWSPRAHARYRLIFDAMVRRRSRRDDDYDDRCASSRRGITRTTKSRRC